MFSISSEDVLAYLNSKGLKFEWVNQENDFFVVASIFNPVNKGFYFYCGQDVPRELTDSLILIEKGKTSVRADDSNSFIIVDTDPQVVFYSFLCDQFARKSNGQISSTAIIHPEAQLGNNVQIDHFCVIGKCQIDDNCIIGSHTVIHDNSLIGTGTTVESHSDIGTQGIAWVWNIEQTEKIVQPQLGGVKIGNHCFLGANSIIVRGSLNESTEIGSHSLFAPGARIGHGTRIGNYVHLANNVITGGNTSLGDYCFVGSSAVFRPKVTVHDFTIVGAGAVVARDTSKPGMTLMGVPAKETVSKEHPNGMPKPKKVNVKEG